MFIDTHAHIYLDQFKHDLEDIVDRSKENEIIRIYMPNIDRTSIDAMMEVENRYPGECISMMGLHPCSVNKNFEKELYVVEDWFTRREFVAVGEIGTDLYWDKSNWDKQKEALKIQLQWAIDKDIPAVLHTRESIDETISIVAEFAESGLKGIFHCFSGDTKQAQKITDMGFYLGIGGVATFKNGGLQEVLEKTPLENLVLETDSPYLSPTPYRGKRNEPSRIPIIAEKIAVHKEIEIADVARITTENANKIFRYGTR